MTGARLRSPEIMDVTRLTVGCTFIREQELARWMGDARIVTQLSGSPLSERDYFLGPAHPDFQRIPFAERGFLPI